MTSLHHPYIQFEGKVKSTEKEIKLLKKRLKSLTVSRLIVFLLLLILTIYCLSEKEGALLVIALLLLVPVFVWLVVRHQQAGMRLLIAEQLKKINQEELQRLAADMSGLDDGMKHLDKEHAYANDLDLFGSPSLYQLVNRTTTEKGEAMLIHELLHPLRADQIVDRQNALRELSTKLDFRQEIEAMGRYFRSKDEQSRVERNDRALLNWIKDPERLHRKGLMRAFNLLSPLTLFVLVAIYPAFAIHLLAGFILFHYAIMVGFVSRVNKMSREVTRSLNVLRTYKEIILRLDDQEFDSLSLRTLQDRTRRDGKAAHQIIGELQSILQNFDNRGNMIYGIVNGILLLDIYWYIRAVSWKAHYGKLMLDWISVAAELEMLNSLSAFAYAHPAFVFPTVVTREQYYLNASALGHPLIPAQKRVVNDFKLTGSGTVALVTGSNMSGKSTFLRTVGLNIVMAQLGLPVCAATFEWSPVQVYSGMRTQDDLGESVSSFYAELKRIRKLLDLSVDTPTFYLLDEILKGTNSDDRHKGGIALIAQLTERSAFGLISTHDLALGQLSDTNKKVINYSFNSRLDDGELVFDYRIKEGICESFNASVLMQKMGIIPAPPAS